MENEKKSKATVTSIEQAARKFKDGDSSIVPEGIEHTDIKKLRESLSQIDWNYETLFEDINGFLETHEKSVKKLETSEQEKARIQSDLAKSKRQVQLLAKYNTFWKMKKQNRPIISDLVP